ncbi:MAG: RNA polymerase sigma factor [Clostridia bacterium]
MENIEEIYEKYASLIKNYIYTITENDNLAEDIMQETFIVAINQIDKFRGDCEISVWLRSIAKKILYKETKKNKFENTVSIDEIEISDNKKIDENYIRKENKVTIYKTLQKLDINTREVMYLRITGELSFKEIGQILNKSENWARVTFFRGKQKLDKEDC